MTTTLTTPEQRDGWTVLGAWQSSPNGQWTVTAKRGKCQVLRTERLTPDDVAAYDAAARWAGAR